MFKEDAILNEWVQTSPRTWQKELSDDRVILLGRRRDDDMYTASVLKNCRIWTIGDHSLFCESTTLEQTQADIEALIDRADKMLAEFKRS